MHRTRQPQAQPAIRVPAADMSTLQQTSIVIPFAPGDMTWKELLADLRKLPEHSEIILVAGSEASMQEAKAAPLPANANIILSGKGRGPQMNAGAKAAKKPCLWFLHADSRVDDDCLKAIDGFDFKKKQMAYFGLGFQNDGPRHMGINSFGVWFRSRFLKIPFGDQGFAISKSCFEMLGTFREDLNSGEDHAFVWAARKAGVKLKHMNASIKTSARKYAEHGWGKTTRRHLRETWKQAWQFSGKEKSS